MRDIVLVILRLMLGAIFICRGWDKTFITGVDKTIGYFVVANIPQACLTIWVVALVELAGDALLILGLLAPTVAMVFIVEMIGAWWPMHLGDGLSTRDNDAGLMMSFIGGLVMVLAFSVGRFSLDRQLIR